MVRSRARTHRRGASDATSRSSASASAPRRSVSITAASSSDPNEPEIGWYDVEAHNESGIAAGPWFEFHFDHCRLPESAELWATSPRAVQAFCVGRNVGVQFHPEVDHLQLRDWFASGVEEAREFGVDADALIEQTRLETPAARRTRRRPRRPLLGAHRAITVVVSTGGGPQSTL